MKGYFLWRGKLLPTDEGMTERGNPIKHRDNFFSKTEYLKISILTWKYNLIIFYHNLLIMSTFWAPVSEKIPVRQPGCVYLVLEER